MNQNRAVPIAPQHRWLYPIDWRELSALVRFKRANGRCEHCRRPHGRTIRHLGNGIWWDDDGRTWRDGRGRRLRSIAHPDVIGGDQLVLAGFEPLSWLLVTRVVLASAHLNHDPGDNRPRNLAALCQRCHMAHDAPEHRRRRWANAYRLRALGDLFA